MSPNQAAEVFVFAFCLSLLVAYNVFYFTPWFQRMRIKFKGRTYLNLWAVGLEARSVWAAAMMNDPKEGITATQTVRNMVMGCALLAAAITYLAAQLILLVTDAARLSQVANYSNGDPISGGDPWMPPQAKLAISLGILFLSLLAMTQCVRLSVHLAYLIRAAPVDETRQRRFQKLAFTVNKRSSLYFSLGLRLLYVFFPLFLYIIGPLALLISTLIEVSACLIQIETHSL